MKLSSGQTRYPKFTNVGDSVRGRFVRFQEAVPGKFGPENTLTLEDGDELQVRCPASLAKTLKNNLSVLQPGVMVMVTFVKSVPTNKGNPAKIFDVEVDPDPTGDRSATRPSPATPAATPDPSWLTDNDT